MKGILSLGDSNLETCVCSERGGSYRIGKWAFGGVSYSDWSEKEGVWPLAGQNSASGECSL
jgi:hypothetical protein